MPVHYRKNKINADKKKYHHKLGPEGYETAIPKWDKKEQDLLDKGIVPEPLRDEWELRARNWFLAHGGSYDEEIGDLICSDGLRIPRENCRERAKKQQQDKENDKFNQLLARINEQQKQIDELRGVARQEDPALDITGAPSKRKSSMAEPEAPPDDA
ncbi:hypothetical protein ZWY2020_032656 [Hordeum vulgare]|nr:hypothetical protein ZWY2020_032656 [Hordeum vulgare]